MGALLSAIRPSAPPLTEKNLPDQSGKVFIVTGSTSGVGFELANILYHRNAKVYIAARNPAKVEETISTLKSRAPHSTGSLHPLHLDLSDLTTIKSSAEAFLRDNTRLDILWNNAGVMAPPQGSQTKQGHELQLGTNNIGHHLFTKLLTPLLSATASRSPANSVRVVWVSSSAAELMSPKNGVDMTNLDYHTDQSPWTKYGVSKAGNVFQASEFGRRNDASIVSVSLNPGNLKTELQRYVPGWQMRFFGWALYEPVYGAYTELWAGLSPEVTVESNGAFVAPWGVVRKSLRKDLLVAQRGKEEGGSGIAGEFWEWCEEQIKAFE